MRTFLTPSQLPETDEHISRASLCSLVRAPDIYM